MKEEFSLIKYNEGLGVYPVSNIISIKKKLFIEDIVKYYSQIDYDSCKDVILTGKILENKYILPYLINRLVIEGYYVSIVTRISDFRDFFETKLYPTRFIIKSKVDPTIEFNNWYEEKTKQILQFADGDNLIVDSSNIKFILNLREYLITENISVRLFIRENIISIDNVVPNRLYDVFTISKELICSI